MTTTLCSAPTSPLLTPEQTADLLGVTTTALEAQRVAGIGPKYHDIGDGLIRYSTADVVKRLSARRC